MPAPALLELFGAGAVVPFTPAALPGLSGWWDASVSSSVHASAGRVSQWDDLSGVGNHWTQGTAGQQPLTGSHTVNSLNAVYFDASSRWMDSSMGTNPATSTFLAVVKFAGSADRIIIGLDSGSGGLNWRANTKMDILSNGTALIGSSSTNVDANAHVYGMTRTNGAGWACYLDGAADGSGTNATTWTASGHHWRLGADGSSSLLNADLCELIYSTSILGSTDLALAETYLKAKWGTP